MKTLVKYAVWLFFVPFIMIAGIVACLRLLFILTVVFTWDQAKEMSDKMLLGLHHNIQKLKK